MQTGDYLEIDGRPAVRLERIYPHPIERVWAAITDVDELEHWFPSRAEIDLRVGGQIAYSADPYTDNARGEVLTLDPPRGISFTWGADELRLSLDRLGPSETRLVLIDLLESKPEAARNGAGWTVCLAELDKYFAGTASGGPHSADALPWQPVYDAHVEAGLPSGAWIPDGV